MTRKAPVIERNVFTESPNSRNNEGGNYSNAVIVVDVSETELIALPMKSSEAEDAVQYRRYMWLMEPHLTGREVSYTRRGNLIHVLG